MAHSSRELLIEALRLTFAHIEAATEFGPDDPVLLELKRIVLCRIADLENLCPRADDEAPIGVAAD